MSDARQHAVWPDPRYKRSLSIANHVASTDD